jgi:hypothetical protein
MLLRNTLGLASLSALITGVIFATILFSPLAYAASEGECETVILNGLCGKGSTDIRSSGVMDILKLAIRILTGLVGAAAIAALVYAGILYSSAGDNTQQISSAKEMIRNTIIGIISFALMFFALQWLIPGGVF